MTITGATNGAICETCTALGHEPHWTIPRLLAAADELRLTAPPKYSWDAVRKIVTRGELVVLVRDEVAEHLYTGHFRPMVAQNYGTTATYLRERLGWTKLVAPEDVSSSPAPYFTGSEGELDGEGYVVRRNDWPYALPPDVDHFLVWTRKPIVHEQAFPTKHSYSKARQAGIFGFTGAAPPEGIEVLTPEQSELKSEVDEGSRYIDGFIRRRWPCEDGWETAWLVNPVHLQTVPELPHAHVFAKRS